MHGQFGRPGLPPRPRGLGSGVGEVAPPDVRSPLSPDGVSALRQVPVCVLTSAADCAFLSHSRPPGQPESSIQALSHATACQKSSPGESRGLEGKPTRHGVPDGAGSPHRSFTVFVFGFLSLNNSFIAI